MQPRNRRRVAAALVASALIHLLLLAVYLRMADWYHRQELRPTRYLPDLLLLAPALFRQETTFAVPERLLERIAAAEPESPPLPGLEIPAVAPVVVDSLQPAAGLQDGAAEPGQRPTVFIVQQEPEDLTLTDRAVETAARLRDQVDAYARFWLPRADTTTAAGRAQTQAEAVVARAFQAMGGLDRLLKVTRIRRVVWIIAADDALDRQVRSAPPYPYPIGIWDDHGLDKTDRLPFRVDLDLSGAPISSYVWRNPVRARSAYYLNFDGRWTIAVHLPTSKVRMEGEKARWHIVDHFLGEGVRLEYLGRGTVEVAFGRERPVDGVYVDDRKFGRIFETFFDVDTGLPVVEREGLLPFERKIYQQQTGHSAPIWTTTYDDYREVGGVRLAHRWVRSASFIDPKLALRAPKGRVDVRFNIALNGADPDTVAPTP